jgi:prepilin-type N-terminal cleavage/methylation domain-containing protein
MRPGNRRGFTLVEVLLAILLGGLLVVALAHLADAIGHVGDANRSGSDARALEWTTERVLRRALEEAGDRMPSSPNLGGVGVRVASRADGTPADTLYILRGDTAAFAVAARGCRAGAEPCIVLLGDRRSEVAPGDVLVVGGRGTGLAAYQVMAAPSVFYAPCAGNCPERLVCPITPGPLQSFLRVVGSVRQPSGTPSSVPCTQAYFPDGSRCEEVVQPVAAGARQEPACRATGPSSAFTELRVADRTALLGFPAPPVPLTRSGVGGVPAVRAVRVHASRFWVRESAADTVLVRQNDLADTGEWRAPVVVAGPVRGLRVESLQDGTWMAGTGVSAGDLQRVAGNPNWDWRAAPAASGTLAGSGFVRGHNTISAVRVQYLYRTATASQGLPITADSWIVVATPSLLEGGTGDAR